MPAAAAMPPPSAAALAAPMAPATGTWWSRLLGGSGRANGPGRFIHIEVRQGGTTIRVDWPLEGAEQCQAWLREIASAG